MVRFNWSLFSFPLCSTLDSNGSYYIFILTIITAHIMLQRIQLAFEKRHMKQTSQEPIEQLNTSNFTQQFPANSFTLYDDK